MNTLFQLLADLIRTLLRFALRLMETLIGCAVRLLYWTVRTYGWGRTGGFLAALATSYMVFSHLAWRQWGITVTALGIVAGAVVLYGGGWLLIKNIPSALNAVWAGRLQRVRLPVPAEENSPYSSSPPTFPVVNKGLVSNERVDLGKEIPLWDRFMALETFQEAWQRVALRGGGPGADGVTVEQFSLEAQHNLEALRAELGEGQYHPHPHPRCVEVPKRSGGTRRLVIFSVRERVVHLAAYLVLSPFWETRFAPCSYAYRPRRSANQAVAAVERLLTQGKVWVVDADIESFFDTVSHHRLWSLLETWLPDVRMLWLLQVSLNAASIAPERGLAQGSPLSPLLANVYLHDFDTLLLQARQSLIRYSDDFLLICATRIQAEEALRSVERLLQGLELRLKAEKTRIVHRDEGFTFLGYTFDTTGKHPSPQAVESLQTRLESAYSEIKRSQIVAGWQGYFGKETLGACALKEHGPLVRGAVASEPVEPAGNRDPDLKLDDQEDDPWWQEADESGLIDDGKDDLPTNWPASDKIHGPTPCPGNWEGYRLRFLSRPGIFARYWESPPERQGYLPVRRDVADAELAAHMKGDLALATYLLRPEGLTKALVLDVDGPETSTGEAKSFPLAHRLAAGLGDQGLAPLWFTSGGKGFHLWLCFEEPVPAKPVLQWSKTWLESYRPFPEGVLVEIFPKQDHLAPGAVGSLIRIPLGRHPKTGRWSRLLNREGQECADPWSFFDSAPWADLSQLKKPHASPGPVALPKPPENVLPVVEGCAWLRALIDKALCTHNLRHAERLVLLYVLGPIGEEGRVYLHQVIALCANYNPRLTEQWIRRLEEGHKPIRCSTLQEWLLDHLPGVTCECPLKKRSRCSPLDLTNGRKAGRPTVDKPPSLDREWWEIAGDLFDPVETEGAEEG